MPKETAKPPKNETRKQLAQRLQIKPGEFEFKPVQIHYCQPRHDDATGRIIGYDLCSCGAAFTGYIYAHP